MPEALAAALAAADALARDLPITERTGRLSVRAAAQGPAEIGIYGEIGWEVTARDVRDALKPLAGRDLLVRVNSPGGSAFDGFAIYNMLARHEGRKTVQIEALAASAASYIAMAGDVIEMPAASFLMIHNSGVLAMGDRNTLAETIAILERLDAAMRDIYAARTGLAADAIAAMMDAETWMTAEEAVEHGFATAILPPAAAPQAHALTARAKAVLSGFRAAPAAAVALSTSSTPPAAPAQQQEASMPEAKVTQAGGTPPAPSPNPVAAPPLSAPPKASLTDLQGIVARSNGRLSSDFIVAQLAAGATMDTARDAAIEAVASAPRPATHITITSDERETVRAGMQAALAFRAGDRKVDLRAGPGRPYAHMSLREMARAAVQSVGGKPDGLSPLEIAGAALGLPGFMASAGMHTTSDFPLILGNTARKVLLDAYIGASSEWRTIARPTSHSDFKATSYLRLSEGPALLEVPEHAEFKYGSMSEKGESLYLKTWGRIIAITRQAIINDDLSAFTRLPTLYGRSAADLVSNLVWAVLTANPTMGDGVALFHASHGNLAASGSAITEASLAAAITAMRKQKGVTDNPIVITPKYLVVSPDKEFEAKKLLATTFNLPDGTANIVGQGLTLVVTPWLTGNAWYLSVDPNAFETIFVPFLNGNEEPRIEERVGFEVDGLEIKAALDVNAAPIDWRGLYKNPGA
ncbi:ClpP-like prohead protease/major capsid protein fusion protein [Roseococcus pinisoli]|uniref:ATP-dependent Clp protease proteolytic subunit n=1 Tax=Roseococcus pinisoli TaxID=2835040 RepID=A0ABS5Q9Z1_9PROT|nr:ClpP-like prohead protease/major capsid protein fusion protein [Roseococcus pinisoli]MBS7810529.1 ATP-dependent Clp protease proteolytic subunit [Roseococcus pinisoli]